MYNTDFLPQMEEFRKYLWGAGRVDTRAAAEEGARMSYLPPKDVEIIPCRQAPSGELVPVTYELGELEEKIDPE